MKKAIITGANGQLGNAFTEGLVKKGYFVYAIDINIENIKVSDSIESVKLDITDETKVHDFFSSIQDLDVLINNAGIYRSGIFNSVNKDSWVESFITNTIGPYEVIEHFLPNILKGRERKVVSITSKMGSIDDNTSGGSYIYRSSKTALNSMMRSLTHDLKSHNIATMALHPGWVRTDMGGPGGWIDVKESVSGMIDQISNLSLQNTGQYIDYAGKIIKW